MVKFINNNSSKPLTLFRKYYKDALKNNQKFADAISVASYCKNTKEIDSRFVNLKIVDNERFIFFSNYNSPKSIQFDNHNKVSVNLFWDKINIQVRIKANIGKMPHDYNQRYFETRDLKKNALSISSKQSDVVGSFDQVINNYNNTLNNLNLTQCPSYWGGFFFNPHYIEFWKSGENRLNKRDLYVKNGQIWENYILEP